MRPSECLGRINHKGFVILNNLILARELTDPISRPNPTSVFSRQLEDYSRISFLTFRHMFVAVRLRRPAPSFI